MQMSVRLGVETLCQCLDLHRGFRLTGTRFRLAHPHLTHHRFAYGGKPPPYQTLVLVSWRRARTVVVPESLVSGQLNIGQRGTRG
jgi:hypothetical protein